MPSMSCLFTMGNNRKQLVTAERMHLFPSRYILSLHSVRVALPYLTYSKVLSFVLP